MLTLVHQCRRMTAWTSVAAHCCFLCMTHMLWCLEQIVGFVVLLAGTSVYNELLRTCLPDERERHRRQLRVPLHLSTAPPLLSSAAKPVLLNRSVSDCKAHHQGLHSTRSSSRSIIIKAMPSQIWSTSWDACTFIAASPLASARLPLDFDGGGAQEPLLHEGALTWTPHQSPAAAIPVPGWGRPPLAPASRPSRPRNIDSTYTMARSMRIAPGVIFLRHSISS